jgi:hypothetical protein
MPTMTLRTVYHEPVLLEEGLKGKLRQFLKNLAMKKIKLNTQLVSVRSMQKGSE